MEQVVRYYATVSEYLDAPLSGPHLLLVGQESASDLKQLVGRSGVWGALFPQIIFEDAHYDHGAVALALTSEPLLLRLDQPVEASTLPQVAAFTVFVDGLSAHIDSFLEALYEALPFEVRIFGGGAGTLALKQQPVIFTPSGIYRDVALLIPHTYAPGIGVNHGWSVAAGPFIATKTEGNTLIEIAYKPAFEFYRPIVESISGQQFTSSNFFDIAKGFPIGIQTLSEELIVRDPIAVGEDGRLLLVGRINENSVIMILRGDGDNLTAAAKNAAQQAIATSTSQPTHLFVVDCISRVLFLQDRFSEEIAALRTVAPGLPLVGILSLGEIANKSERYIEFYNKTCVVSAL